MPWLVLLLSALGAAIFAFAGWRKWQRYALVKNTPTSPCGQLRPGFREAKGKLRALGKLVTSPMAGTECVYSRFLVEEKVGNKNKSWRAVVDETNSADCVIDDGTGTAAIEFIGAELHFKVDHQESSGFLNDAPPQLERLLKDRGLSSTGMIFNRTMRYSETVVHEGEEIYVLGHVDWRNDRPSFSKGAAPIYALGDEGEDSIADKAFGGAVLHWVGALGIVALGVITFFSRQ